MTRTRYELGYELRLARMRKGLYMWQIGQLLNISESCVCRYENGQREIPDDLLARWAFIVGAKNVLKMRCNTCPINNFTPEAA